MNNNLKIINYLGKHPNQSFTLNELSKLIKIPYATFYRTISKMKDLTKIKIIGQAKIVSINGENPLIKSYLAISSYEEKKDFLKKNPLINKISSELNSLDIVLLFGSYAKGHTRDDSDIDLLVINKIGDRSINFSKYEFLFKKKINPIFITKSEFIKMLKDSEENVGKQALKDHIILNNPENFWRLF